MGFLGRPSDGGLRGSTRKWLVLSRIKRMKSSNGLEILDPTFKLGSILTSNILVELIVFYEERSKPKTKRHPMTQRANVTLKFIRHSGPLTLHHSHCIRLLEFSLDKLRQTFSQVT